MPYFIKKSRGRDAYWVVNKQTGKKYSHEPLPYETAMKQMRALYSQEAGNKVDLKGGDAPTINLDSLIPTTNSSLNPQAEQIIKNLMKREQVNLRMKAEANKQIQQAHLDGNYLVGGYGGTDEEFEGKTWEDLNSILSQYTKSTDPLFTFFSMLGESVINIGKGLASTFQGKWDEALNYLDKATAELPGIEILNKAGHIIDKASKGEAVTGSDWADLGGAIIDTAVTVATEGAGKVAGSLAKAGIKVALQEVKTILENEIKKQIKDTIKDSIKDSLLNSGKQILKKITEKPDPLGNPYYKFHSQITGEDRFINLSGHELTVDDSADADTKKMYEAINKATIPLNEESKRIISQKLSKNEAQRSQLQDNSLVRKILFYREVPQRNEIIQDMISKDRQTLSQNAFDSIQAGIDSINIDDEVIKVLKNLPNKKLIGVYVTNSDNIPEFYPFNEQGFRDVPWTKDYYDYFMGDEFGVRQRQGSEFIKQIQSSTPVYNTDGIIKSGEFLYSLGDYSWINKFNKQNFNSQLDKINTEIQQKVKEYQDEDKAFITSAIKELDDSKEEIVDDVLDSILKDIGQAGGTLNMTLYNQLKDVAEQTAGQDIAKYVTDNVRKAQIDKYKDKGEQLTDDEKEKLVDDLKNGLAQAVHDDVLTSTSKLTLSSKSKELESMKADYDKAKQLYEKKITPIEQQSEAYYYPAKKSDVLNNAIRDLNDETNNIIPRYEALQNEVLGGLSVEKYDAQAHNTLTDTKKKTLRDNITQKYNLLNQQAKNTYDNTIGPIQSQIKKETDDIKNQITGLEGQRDTEIGKLESSKKQALNVNYNYSTSSSNNAQKPEILAYNQLFDEWKKTDDGKKVYKTYGANAPDYLVQQEFNKVFNAQPMKDEYTKRVEKLKSSVTSNFDSQIDNIKQKYQSQIDKLNSQISQISIKYKPQLDKAKSTYDSIVAVNNKNKDSEIKAGLDAIDKDKSGEFRVKTVDEIKQELGLKPKPALVKQPAVQLVQPPVVSSQQQQKIQPALSKNVPVAPTVIVQPTKPVEVPKEEKPAEKVMATPAPAPAPAPVLSEEERQYKANLEEIRKYEKERQTGEIKDYKPAVQKALDDIERQGVPTLQRKAMRSRQPSTRMFGKQSTMPSRRVGR